MPTLISEQHPTSRRWAIVDDDSGHSVWLYLTGPDSMRPIRDAFVFSKVAPIPREQLGATRAGPPPVCVGFMHAADVITQPNLDLQLRWSSHGNSVCILLSDRPFAFVSSRLDRGHSRVLTRAGPWGEPWNDDTYAAEFAG